MSDVARELRIASRSLRRSPAFTAAAVLTLALGIGGSTLVFSLVRGVLLKPLPLPSPERVVMVWERQPERGVERSTVAPGNFADWSAAGDVFSALSAARLERLVFVGGDAPEQVLGASVTPSYFKVLGVTPLVGALPPVDARGTVVLSHALWQRRFGGDRGIVGRAVRIGDEIRTVAAVLPPGALVPRGAEAWIAEPLTAEERADRESRFLDVVGRLRPGVSPATGESRLATVAARLAAEHPETNAGWGIELAPLREAMVGDVRPALQLLMVAVTIVLVLACANVANLLLVRYGARRGEIALRTALGAGRRRMVRPLLFESALLAFAGGGLGLLLAALGGRAVLALSPVELPRFEEVGVDAAVVLFALATAAAAALLLAVLPALSAARLGVAEWLRESAVRSSSGRRVGRVSRLMVTSQVVLAFVLLSATVVTVRGFVHLLEVEPGFSAEGVLTAKLWLAEERYAEPHRRIAFLDEVLRGIGELPHVVAVGGATTVPLEDADIAIEMDVEGRRPAPGEAQPSTGFDVVTPGYFQALGIPLLQGRGLSERDRADAPPVAVINRALAERYWPGEDPVGRRVTLHLGEPVSRKIVGVVGDVRHTGLGAEPRPALFVPFKQLPTRSLRLVVKSRIDPGAVADDARRVVLAADSEQPLGGVETLERLRSASLARERFSSVLLGAFAVLGVVLAGVGLYGMVAQSVTSRTGEIGIRMALGADPAAVQREVLVDGLRVVVVGIVLGVVVSLPALRWMEGRLGGVGATGLGVLAITAVFLLLVAAAAAFLPARRAASLDPSSALRR